ncbi:MAG: hypothetical protein H6Q55_193 [Deltaproteobacteria bacterium]|nr:hypothetical protein [Deltaproteobacteria bacterium]
MLLEMSRPLRIEYPEAWYHVMNRGRRNEHIFLGSKDYVSFLDLLHETIATWNLRVAAYCLMPTHYHLLVQTPGANLSRCMRHIDGVYTQRFNRARETDGSLFRGRYKSIVVGGDSYLLQLVRYIHRNPLRAGLSDSLEKYPWTSHRAYLSDAESWNWIHKEPLLTMLSPNGRGRITAYRRFVGLEDPDTIIDLLERKKWPAILGPQRFINKTREKFFSGNVHEEIPQSRELAPTLDTIRITVCASYRISEGDLERSRRGTWNEARNVAIYLTRRLRGETLSRIGEYYQMSRYSSVSSVIQRMKRLMDTDQALKKKVGRIASQLIKSQA